jgi:hypothetical protein
MDSILHVGKVCFFVESFHVSLIDPVLDLHLQASHHSKSLQEDWRGHSRDRAAPDAQHEHCARAKCTTGADLEVLPGFGGKFAIVLIFLILR